MATENQGTIKFLFYKPDSISVGVCFCYTNFKITSTTRIVKLLELLLDLFVSGLFQ